MKLIASFTIVYFIFVVSETSADVLLDTYLGCFRNFDNQTSLSPALVSQSMTIDLCIETCINKNSTFSGLQAGSRCFCGEDFNEVVAESNCARECSGNDSQYCGGSKDISVYSVCSIGYYGAGCDSVCHCAQQAACHRLTGSCPTGCDDSWEGQTCDTANASPRKPKWYIGCYGDRSTRAMEEANPDGTTGYGKKNSINICLNICAKFNYTYSGTQYYYDCNCGERYDKYGEKLGCTYACSGNQSQMCGGWYANSVYSVCPTGSFSLNCLGKCNCMNDARCIYRNGTCPSGCKPGWTGTSCSVRDCSVANGSCSAPNEFCETVDLKYAKKTRCGCKKGFTRNKPWDNCADIDECLDLVSACGVSAYNCTNVVGKFVCGYCPDNQIPENGKCVSAQSSGAMIGVTVACLVVLVIIFVAIILLYRKRCKNSHSGAAIDHKRVKDIEEEEIIQKQNGTFENDYETECPYVNVEQTVTRFEVERLAIVVKYLNETPAALENEFNSVPETSGAATNIGRRKELKTKNRFKNILPYDHNRVILSKVGDQDYSDYINASYVMGYKASENLIATQGPTSESVDDFWRMIVEKRVKIIVMMTNLEENGKKKCERYWPNAGETQNFGGITVRTMSERKWQNFEERTMMATEACYDTYENSKTMEVIQWHYLSWPDHGVPKNIRSFLAFRRKIRNSMSSDSVTMVHCSAGAGRTGTYIAIDLLLEEAKTGYIDVLDCLKRLRQQRTQMIQTLEQYKFVYTALLVQFSTDDTVLRRDDYENQLNELRKKDPTSGKTKLQTQFETLNHQITNEHENNEHFKAIEIQSTRSNVYYLVKAISPSETSDDLWKLCSDRKSELFVFISESQDAVPFIPSQDRPVSMTNFNLILNSMTEESGVTVCRTSLFRQSESVYANQADDTETQRVTLLNVHAKLSPNGDCFDYESLLSAYTIMKRFSQTLKGPIIIMSQTNVRLIGFCVAAFNAFDMIAEENEVDVYQIVNDIRSTANSRFIPTLNVYEELHDAIQQYIARECHPLTKAFE